MEAIVTDVQHRAVVSGIRALGRSGLRVVALSPRRNAAGLWSRYAAVRAVGPDPATDPSGFVDKVRQLVDRHGAGVVYPGTEASIAAMVSRWSSFGADAVLPYSGPESLRAIRDKRRLPETAARVGIRTPATLMECTADELERRAVPIPCIVKPADPAARPSRPGVITSTNDLEFFLHHNRFSLEEPLLVQELVTGDLTSLELVLSRDGKIVERFQQVAARTWPPCAGSISLATSVDADEKLLEQGGEMLRRVGYWGLAQLDFVQRGDGPVLIDVNPRFYSCMPLALACGVNLPAAWHDVALDRATGPPSPYRTGVTFRWLEGELIAALRGDRERIHPGAHGPSVGAMWARDDPWAAALMGAGALSARAQRLLRLGRNHG